MKTCNKCGVDKPIAEFSKKKRSKDGLQGHCKGCHRAYTAQHYRDTKERYKESRAASVARQKAEVQAFICQYLSEHPCVDCGEADIVVLEFDHLDNKEFDIGAMRYNLSRVILEVAKCEVRCANCHRRKTAERLGGTYRSRYVEAQEQSQP